MSEDLPGQTDFRVVSDQPRSAANSASKRSDSLGLHELAKADKVVVQQLVEASEDCCCGYEGENHYEVSDSYGHGFLKAKEQSNCCSRQCCDQLHSLTIEISDRQDSAAVLLRRPFRCDNLLCCPCLNQRLEVEAPPGVKAGHVEQNCSAFSPSFDVCDSQGKRIYTIEGPSSCHNMLRSCGGGCFCCCCPFSGRIRRCCQGCCGCCSPEDVEFRVRQHGLDVGLIAKKWSSDSGGEEAHSDSDRFGVDFPDGADVKMKAVLLSACFLLDYLYFERDGGERPKAGMVE